MFKPSRQLSQTSTVKVDFNEHLHKHFSIYPQNMTLIGFMFDHYHLDIKNRLKYPHTR